MIWKQFFKILANLIFGVAFIICKMNADEIDKLKMRLTS